MANEKLLIDVDGRNYPNLALMKISAYHKAQGDTVEWWWGFGHKLAFQRLMEVNVKNEK